MTSFSFVLSRVSLLHPELRFPHFQYFLLLRGSLTKVFPSKRGETLWLRHARLPLSSSQGIVNYLGPAKPSQASHLSHPARVTRPRVLSYFAFTPISPLGPGRQGFASSGLQGRTLITLYVFLLDVTINLNTIYTCEARMTPIF